MGPQPIRLLNQLKHPTWCQIQPSLALTQARERDGVVMVESRQLLDLIPTCGLA